LQNILPTIKTSKKTNLTQKGLIKKITRESLAEELTGYTSQGNRVAKGIKSGDIEVNILGDELLEKFYIKKTQKTSAPQAYSKGRNIYVRRSSDLRSSEVVHEGTHVLDFINEFKGTLFQWEKRAYFFERQFQIAKKMFVEYPNIKDMLLHIFFGYN
jgi:hypothetical protein